MELRAAIEGRRSIRKFKVKEISREDNPRHTGDGTLGAVLGQHAAVGILCADRKKA